MRRIKAKEEEYARGFQDELQGLISRVQERAKVRYEEALKEVCSLLHCIP